MKQLSFDFSQSCKMCGKLGEFKRGICTPCFWGNVRKDKSLAAALKESCYTCGRAYVTSKISCNICRSSEKQELKRRAARAERRAEEAERQAV